MQRFIALLLVVVVIELGAIVYLLAPHGVTNINTGPSTGTGGGNPVGSCDAIHPCPSGLACTRDGTCVPSIQTGPTNIPK
jgi:hypothetical protein